MMPEDVRNEIKSYIAMSGWTLTDIVKVFNARRAPEEQTTTQNISNKLTRGTIKYSECKEIAEIIGFEIMWVRKPGYSRFVPMVEYSEEDVKRYRRLQKQIEVERENKLRQGFYAPNDKGVRTVPPISDADRPSNVGEEEWSKFMQWREQVRLKG